jgi:anti-sigma-K factor RskA
MRDEARVRQLLAAEYVLGTLHGAARKRFETALRESPQLRKLVTEWETRLAGLAALEPRPVAPPAALGRRIERSLGIDDTATVPGRRRLWLRLATAMAALVILVLGAQLLLHGPSPPPHPGVVAAIANPGEGTTWVLEREQNGGLRVRAVRPVDVPPERQCYLWLRHGQTVTLLAELPEMAQQSRLLRHVDGLAPGDDLLVSMEPRGNIPPQRPGRLLETYQVEWLDQS